MKLFDGIKKAVFEFVDDECIPSAAALAYYTIFSLPPLLVIVFAAAGWFGVKHSKIDGLIKEQLGLPISAVAQRGTSISSEHSPDSSRLMKQETEKKTNSESGLSTLPGVGWLMKIAGIGILIFSATGLFTQLQHALNRAWEVEPDPDKSGLIPFLTKRMLSLGMVVVIAFLLFVSLVMSTIVDEMVSWIQGPSPSAVIMAVGIISNNAITLIIATLLFAAMFKILPDAKTCWRDIFVGAAITAVLFVVGKSLIGWYLQHSQLGSSWGSAASSMVAVLVWVYYTSLIVLFGAELAQVWANQFGSGIQPEDGAVRIIEEKRYVRDESANKELPT